MNGADKPGLFASLRRLVGDFVELAQVRVELFATELQQEKVRAFEALAWLALALLAVGMSLLLTTALIVMLVPEAQRLLALGVLALLYLAGAAIAMRVARARLREGIPFEGSLGELRRDRDALTAREPSVSP
jgi:uncharacterized membrane protein YqjE